MPSNDQEVYAYLTLDQSTPIEVDMLTYAMFANERQEWLKHFEKNNNAPPTAGDIES